MDIRQATLDEVVGIYKPQWRYLTAAELNYPTAKGTFRIGESVYGHDTGHVNVAELFVCYSQLGYALLLEANEHWLLKWQEEPQQPFSLTWKRLMIATMNTIRFNREIVSKQFEGEVTIHHSTLQNGHYLFRTSYDFAGGSATGTILLALPRNLH